MDLRAVDLVSLHESKATDVERGKKTKKKKQKKTKPNQKQQNTKQRKREVEILRRGCN